jgi:hypothetical protein
MRPDPKASKDKARLADKKAKKAEAKAARKAAADADVPDEARLVEALRAARPRDRAAAFAALAKVSRAAALATLRAIAELASGQNQRDLAGLLFNVGDDDDIDDVTDGVYGDVDASAFDDDRVAAIVVRLLRVRHTLAPGTGVKRRLRRLGLVPCPAPVRLHRSRALGAAMRDLGAALVDDDNIDDDVRAVCVDALLALEPAVLWAKRAHVPVDIAVAAAIGAGVLDKDDVAAVDAFVDVVRTLSPALRRERLRAARLPASAHGLKPRSQVALLRLIVDDDDFAADHLIAVRALVAIGSAEAQQLVLRRPGADPEATVAIVAGYDFDEAFDVVAPLWARSRELRDRWLHTPHARHPRLLPHVVPLLVADPMGAMAFFARSDDTDAAAVEVAAAFGVVDDNDAALMLAGLCARELGPIAREAARRRSFSAILHDAAHAPRALLVTALEVLLPRTAQHLAVVDALARLRETE